MIPEHLKEQKSHTRVQREKRREPLRRRSAISIAVVLAFLIAPIVSVQATSVVYIKTHHTPSAFKDPSGFYDGYTPGTSIRFHIYLNVTTSFGGSVVAITNLTMADTLPVGLTYVPGSQITDPAAVSFSAVGQVLVWNWSSNVLNTVVNPPELPADVLYEATAEFNATVDNTVPDDTYLNNIAQASYNEVITHVLSQPGTSDTVWIAKPILDIIKQGPTAVENGSSFNYVLTLNNTGSLDASGIDVSDFLPSGAIHAPGTATASTGSFTVDSGTLVVWTGMIGNVSGSHIVTITIPVAANTPPATSVTNAAGYTAYPSFTEFTNGNATCVTQVLHPSIDVTKHGPVGAHVGDTITYTIVVTNTGDCPLSNVTVVDSLLGPIYSNGLALGETKTFNVTYTVKASDPSPLLNTVTASGKDSLATSVSDSASWSVIILQAPVGGYTVDLSMKTSLNRGAINLTFVALFSIFISCETILTLRRIKRKNRD
jgi:uncharacterized repeat protein (TIGR01451 family)